MSASIPTAKQNLRRILVQLFPWLPGFLDVAGAKGRGLAIRTASGLLHLAGGPDDPAVHRVGDRGTAGTVQAIPVGPAADTLRFVNADGAVQTFTFAVVSGKVVITAVPPEPAFHLTTKSLTGSEKVTCA